ncbi:DegT/DnrJ/EryC1/StrS aminotransferase family protein [Xanthomonas sp. 60]
MTPKAIPVNSLSRHIEPLQDALASAATSVVHSGYFVLGPSVRAFEDAFADYCGVAHCIGVANGTDALELSLRAVNVAPGDRVAVVANAAMYGTSTVLACGAEPIFVDVLVGNATMDPAKLRTVLEAQPVKAVIVTHLYGQLSRIEEIAAICGEFGASLIEDCAQAHGARNAQGLAGSFGDIASFSFYPTKNLGALGDGGAVTTNSPQLAERVRQLRQYGWTQKYTNGIAGGRNSRLDEIQASMLSVMLPKLDAWNSRRRAIAARYSQEIRNSQIITHACGGDDYVAHLYVIRTQNRDMLKAHLDNAGVQTDVHYPLPDYKQPCHGGRFDDVTLPVTEVEAATVLTLPCFPELTDAEVDRVIAACNSF